jgi:hypothetical protein
MVKVHLDALRGSLVTGELELFDEVLVGYLGETTALVGVEVDIVHIEGPIEITSSSRGSGSGFGSYFRKGSELNIHLDLVVLKGNERESKTGITAEPELKGHIYGASIGAHTGRSGHKSTVRFYTVDHGFITRPMPCGLRELVPDLEPITVVLVDALTTDLNLDGLDELVTHPFFIGTTGNGREIYI